MVTPDYFELVKEIRKEAKQLGFAELRITDLDMSEAAPHLAQWLQKGHHGDMNYCQGSLEQFVSGLIMFQKSCLKRAIPGAKMSSIV
jgi:epoxyqueuosine reductase QueG